MTNEEIEEEQRKMSEWFDDESVLPASERPTYKGSGPITKKFTAEEFNKQPAPVYRAADKDGSVEISHTHYPDSVFVMELKDTEKFDNVFEGEYKQNE